MIFKKGLNLPGPRFSCPVIQGPCQPQVSPAELARPQERHLVTMLVQAMAKANRGCSPGMELTLRSTQTGDKDLPLAHEEQSNKKMLFSQLVEFHLRGLECIF